jgi:hypothetical protein
MLEIISEPQKLNISHLTFCYQPVNRVFVNDDILYVTGLKIFKRVVIFTVPIYDFGRQDILVGLASGYGLDSQGSVPGRVKRLLLSTLQHIDRLWGPSSLLSNWYRGFFALE